MKYLYTILCFVSFSVTAQINDEPVKLVHYVVDSFTNGRVLLKSGVVTNQVLNYNLITKEMIFDNNGTYLAIANSENVDTVFLGERKFVPIKNAFYEVLTGGNYPLFMEYTCTIKDEGVSTGFGATNTSAANTLKSLENNTGAYKLKLPEGFKVIPVHTYYIRKSGEYVKANNEQQLIKLFPHKKEMIKNLIKNNHTNFSRKEDVTILIHQIQ